MGRLDQRIALITGAGGGIGRAIAREFAQEGAVAAVLDRNAAGVETVCGEITAAGGVARGFAADVTDYERMRAVRDALIAEFGRLDILVNNAAISAEDADLLESTLEDWRRVLQVNLEAVYRLSQLVAEQMVRQKSGRIVQISSIQAFMSSGRKGSYNAAKAGVVGLTHSMAVELAPHGILVNAIAPGFIQTPMSILPSGVNETETEEFRRYYLETGRIPLRRAGQPHDIAGAALFLASDDCRYLTGQLIVVDGGLSLVI